MSKRKAYPQYKPSGVEWLGEIPEHWEAKAIRRIFVDQNGATPKSSQPAYWDGEILWVTPDDLGKLDGNILYETRRKITQEGYDNSGVSLVPAGSIILSTRAPIGHVAIAGAAMTTNQGCRSLVFTKNAISTYFYYQFLAMRPKLQSLGRGTTFMELNRDGLMFAKITVPPFLEQQSIAAFLDRETASIDTLIAKKQQQIALLQEKRTALISHAVTKGLDPTVKMKDSGVEWLGEIPEHWEVMRLKFVGEAIIGLTYSPNDVTDEHEGTLVLRASNIQRGQIVLTDNVFVKMSIPDKLRTRENDILICSRNGSQKLVGKSGKIMEEQAGLSFGAFTTVFRSSYNDFLFYLFNSGLVTQQAGSYQTSTIFQLTTGILNEFEIALPPIEEQTAIAAFLNRETASIDTLISKVTHSITLLKEHRTALISAAVTGKIDVREEV